MAHFNNSGGISSAPAAWPFLSLRMAHWTSSRLGASSGMLASGSLVFAASSSSWHGDCEGGSKRLYSVLPNVSWCLRLTCREHPMSHGSVKHCVGPVCYLPSLWSLGMLPWDHSVPFQLLLHQLCGYRTALCRSLLSYRITSDSCDPSGCCFVFVPLVFFAQCRMLRLATKVYVHISSYQPPHQQTSLWWSY